MKRPLRISYCPSLVFAFLIVGGLCLGASVPARAQAGGATATLNGTVKDPSEAVVSDAAVTLTNTLTGVKRATRTNAVGNYSIVNITPGSYVLEVGKEGFATEKQREFSLEVNQTATIDFTLRIGSAQTTMQVAAGGLQIETSTAEVGSVVGRYEVNALPLNGRDFTQLLLLSPGASPANQSSNAAGSWLVPYGNVAYPAVNGQTNRSNMFLLDGIINYGSIRDTYAVKPTLDDIQEFKVQSHNDEAQFGQVLGGIVNVVTKSGTNQFHGDAWEFLRNDALDATPYFAESKVPLKQNQFGGAIGGPVILPHYNGRNKTFFYFSYEGFRNHTSANQLYLTPTPAQLGGDFSNLVDTQIYNPYSTAPDPNNPGAVIRQPFMCDGTGNPLPVNAGGLQAAGNPCNKIPPSLLDPTMVNFAKTFFPAPMSIGNPAFNAWDTTPNIIRQDQFSGRVDEQIGEKDRIFGRYTGSWQSNSVSGGFVGLLSNTSNYNYNLAANWAHTFGTTSVLELTFGRVSGWFYVNPHYVNVPSNYLQQSGFAPYFYNHTGSGPVIPSTFVDGYLGGANYQAKIHWSDIYEYRGDLSKTHGKHSFRMGASLATYGWWQPFYGSEDDFEAFQSSDGSGNGGDALASMMLGIPGYAEVDSVYSWLRGGKIIGTYFQDQWRVTDRLTLNLGLRYDLTINPRQGTSSNGSDITGNFNFSNGTYVLQKPAPACSSTQGAPCIPGGALPPDVLIAKNGKVINDVYDNIQPRIGLAYRLTNKTVLHGAFGMFYDNWAALTENQSNYTQSWPNVAFIATSGINLTNPTAFAADPFNIGNGPILPAATPWSQANFFTDPNLKNARSQQYNVGVQRELSSNSSVTANYVGAHTTRIPNYITGNAAYTPGPGDPSLRSPFPYIVPEGYMASIGNSTYNSLQLSTQRRSHNGLTYQIAYTWSKVTDIGCGYSTCDIQDPYHAQNDRGPALFDLRHVFSGSWVYSLPFGAGKKWSTRNGALNRIIGGWQLNGILSFSNGLPYDVQADNAIPNTNNFFGAERADIVGNPTAGTTKIQPINTAAFAVPAAFTFGNMSRNSLRSDWHRNLDLSVFRAFRISESKGLEFRFEAFNATNTPVFGIPDNFISDPNFGLVSSTANTERQLQLALKFYF